MQSFFVSLLKWCPAVVLFAIIVISASYARADETIAASMTNTNPALAESTLIASVGVYDFAIKNQKDATFTLSFDILNRGGVQSGVSYTVNLVKSGDRFGSILADQKVYDKDILDLGAGESMRKEITYVAPAILDGTYIVEIQIRNEAGLVFGSARSSQITLKSSQEGIFVDANSCILMVDGQSEKYTLSQGVDISQDETLFAHCSLKNNFSKSRTVVPDIQTHFRSTSGKIAGSEQQGAITIEPGLVSDIAIKLPKMSAPQAYDAILTFLDNEKNRVSSPIVFHYVLRGQNATIQNFVLDKDYYAKGDTAIVTLTWFGSADNFPENRFKTTDLPQGIAVSVVIKNGLGKVCADEFSRELDGKSGGGLEQLSLLITDDCKNPTVQVKIADASGNVLAQNSYDIQSKSVSSVPDPSPFKKGNDTLALIVYCLVFFLIVLLGVYLIWKNNRSGMAVAVGLLIGVGMFAGSEHAKAENYWINLFYSNEARNFVGNWGAGYQVDLDKSSRVYAPGEPIVVTGSFSSLTCNNVLGGSIDGIINGSRQQIVGGDWDYTNPLHALFYLKNLPPTTFTAPSTPGNYTAVFPVYYSIVFNNQVFFSVNGEELLSGEALQGSNSSENASVLTYQVSEIVIPYTVEAPLTDGVCGSANGKIYETNQMGYAPDTQCANGTPSDTSFPIPGNTFSWTCQGVNGGATSPNCSAERLLPSKLKICPSNATLINQGETKDLTLYYDTRNNCDADVNKPSVSVPALSWTIASDPDHGIESLTPSADKKIATVKAVLDGVTVERLATIGATYGAESATADVTVTNIFPVCGCDATIAETKCNPKTFPGTVGSPVGSPCIQSVCTGTKNCSVQWKEIVPGN